MNNLEWAVGTLLRCYANRVNELGEWNFRKKDELNELYSKAIIMNVQYGYGDFYPIDDFMDDVEGGGIMNYDGIGYLLDANGNEIDQVDCNLEFLEDAKANGAVYVSWFNK